LTASIELTSLGSNSSRWPECPIYTNIDIRATSRRDIEDEVLSTVGSVKDTAAEEEGEGDQSTLDMTPQPCGLVLEPLRLTRLV
jgi:hypothetical protein